MALPFLICFVIIEWTPTKMILLMTSTTAIDIVGAKIYNNKSIYMQQAPMPFLTERAGDFAAAIVPQKK
jgi:hypothetical protein